MMRATIACRHMEGIVRVMQQPGNRRKIWKSIFAPPPRKQKSGFFLSSADSGRLGGAQGQHRRRHRAAGGRLSVCAGRRRSNLSGGQRKRIALSRIFLKNPRILILDEVHLRAGQHLRKAHPGRDRENEGGMRHHGSLHRTPPFTLQNCDEIIVMDKGCIVQRGTCREPESALGCLGTWRWEFANKWRVGFSPAAPQTVEKPMVLERAAFLASRLLNHSRFPDGRAHGFAAPLRVALPPPVASAHRAHASLRAFGRSQRSRNMLRHKALGLCPKPRQGDDPPAPRTLSAA